MKLFYSPGACSIGIHILLLELAVNFELVQVFTKRGETRTPEYLAMNPKGKVPVLVRDDNSVVTEFPAIAFHLAWMHPERRLLAPDVEGMTRALEMFEYLVSTVHMRGLHRMFGPGRIAPGADEAAVWQDGLDIVNAGLSIVEPQLARGEYLMGDFSIVDAALFYILLNAHRLEVPFGPNTSRYFKSMLSRNSVKKAMVTEGVEHWVRDERLEESSA